MNKLLRLFVRPWFSLKTPEGDVITGKQNKDKSLDLTVSIGWDSKQLKLSEANCERLYEWLRRAGYGRHLEAVPLRDTQGDSGPGSGSTRH